MPDPSTDPLAVIHGMTTPALAPDARGRAATLGRGAPGLERPRVTRALRNGHPGVPLLLLGARPCPAGPATSLPVEIVPRHDPEALLEALWLPLGRRGRRSAGSV